MFGNNPVRKPVTGNGNQLEVQSIFKTLQGEGIYTGWPAIFIRLGGCNLQCDFCDTEFESFSKMHVDGILQKVNKLSGKTGATDYGWTHKLVVITGGEPFRQPITQLCGRLIVQDYQVQIETNGTLYRDIDSDVDIVCSPKSSNGRYYPIRDDLLPRINAFKFIISASHSDYQDVAELGQKKHNIPVYVQPMDEQDKKKNAENMAYTVELAQKHGYRLSLQTHKILGVE